MKTWKQLAFAGFFVVIAFVFVACDNSNNPQPNTFTVTFNADNGTENTTQNVIEGNAANKPTDPTRQGFNFVYWFNEATDEEWNFETVITASISLKAKWAPNGMAIENAIPLTFNTWAEGIGNLWFSFIATAATQYIHIDYDMTMAAGFQIHNSSGGIVGSAYPYGGGSHSQTVTIGQVYYIEIQQAGTTEAFKITFNESATPPAITLPLSGVTELAHNIWSEGEFIPSSSVHWFRFEATSNTVFLHSTASWAWMRLYNSQGVAVGPGLQFQTSGSISRNVTTGEVYYIKIWARGSTAYSIAFNSTAEPPAITLPTENVVQLPMNTWITGEIIHQVREEQWFKFIATSNSHYIHIDAGTMWIGFAEIYNTDGVMIGISQQVILPTYFSRAVTSGEEYYLRILPFENREVLKGTFQIAVSETNIPPAISLPVNNINTLIENIWFDGELTSLNNNVQWLSFTASAITQYIHILYNVPTLTGVGVRVYDSNGVRIFGISPNDGNTGFQLAVTVGNTYYLDVWNIPSSSQSGTYRIAFNALTIPPSP